MKDIINSGELGKIESIEGTLCLTKGTVLEKNDIRLQYSLGGGSMMDLGGTFLVNAFTSLSQPNTFP